MNKIRGIFGLNPLTEEDEEEHDEEYEGDSEKSGPALPQVVEPQYPSITAVEWEARERPRRLLENLLKRQVEVCEAEREVILKELLKGPSPYERAAEIAPTHRSAMLMRRLQDSYFREVRRVTNLLLKIKRHERKRKAFEEAG
jgi:hypothetical protein